MKLGKIEKLVTNLHNKTGYVIHIRNLKQTLNHGLIFKNVHRVIKFNQEKRFFKPNLRQKVKKNLRKVFSS